MADKSAIEWTDATWNPVTGCTKVSQGCKHCYAERLSERFRGTPGHPYEHGFDVQLRPERLDMPGRWRKPRRVFVASMGDLFHEDVPVAFVDRVFEAMERADQHTYQILSKRPERMAEYTAGRYGLREPWEARPPRHIWCGTSIELVGHADRLEALRDTVAAVRFVSFEPLLGPVAGVDLSGVDWAIVGGESGPGARPMAVEWARGLRDQCTGHRPRVAFFFKQWGGRTPKAGGDALDGRTWHEYPA